MDQPTRTGTSVLALVALLMLLLTRHPIASPELSDDVASEDVRPEVNSLPPHNLETETLEEVEVLHVYQEDTHTSHMVNDVSQQSHGVGDKNVLSEDGDIDSLGTEQPEGRGRGTTDVPQGDHDVPIMTTVDGSEVWSEHSEDDVLSDSDIVGLHETAASRASHGLHEEEREGEGESGGSGTDEVDITMATDPPISGLPEPPTLPATDVPEYDLLDPVPPQGTPTAAILGSKSAVDHTPTLSPEPIQYMDVPTEALPMTDDEATPTELSTADGEEEADDVPTFTEFSQRKRMEQDSSQKMPTGKALVPCRYLPYHTCLYRQDGCAPGLRW